MNRSIFIFALVVATATAQAQFRPNMRIQPEEKPASVLDAMRGAGDSFFSRLFAPQLRHPPML